MNTNQSPQELRAEISSPNGTTAAGLQVLQKSAFSKMVEQAVEASFYRAQELAQIF